VCFVINYIKLLSFVLCGVQTLYFLSTLFRQLAANIKSTKAKAQQQQTK